MGIGGSLRDICHDSGGWELVWLTSGTAQNHVGFAPTWFINSPRTTNTWV
ncbi:hypothetical protein [Streptomyces hyaluromycini]|nr:hypothetical protein [Streptomyces hyaluromycini]